MCRHITKEQQIEGWRALGALLPDVGLTAVGGVLATVLARLRRAFEELRRGRAQAPLA